MAAKLIDLLPLIGVALLLNIALARIFPHGGAKPGTAFDEGESQGYWFTLVYVFFFAPMQVLFAASCTALLGRTPGKALFRLRVVGPQGRPLTALQAGQRALLEVVSQILCCSGYLVALFDRRRRAGYDRAMGATVTLDLPAPGLAPEASPPASGNRDRRAINSGAALLALCLLGSGAVQTAIKSVDLPLLKELFVIVSILLLFCGGAGIALLVAALIGSRPLRLILVIALALGPAWLLVRLSQPPRANPPVADAYRDSQERFAIGVPEGWKPYPAATLHDEIRKKGVKLNEATEKMLTGDQIVVAFLRFDDQTLNPDMFMVIAFPIELPPPNAKSLDALRDGVVKTVQQSGARLEVESTGVETLDGIASYRLVMKMNPGSPATEMRQRQYVIPGRGASFGGLCSYMAVHSSERDPLCDRWIRSFRLLQRPLPMPPTLWLTALAFLIALIIVDLTLALGYPSVR